MAAAFFPTRCLTKPVIAVVLLSWHFFQLQKFVVFKIKGFTKYKCFIHLYADA